MACPTYLVDLSSTIWDDLGQPAGQSPSYIQSKLLSPSYVGKLNNLLATCYTTATGVISPELGENEQGIYSLLYQADYYTTKLNQTLAGVNLGFVSISDGDSRIVMSSPVEVARMYRDSRNSVMDELTTQVYAFRQQASQPSAVDLPVLLNDLGVNGSYGPAGNPYNYYRS